MKTCLHLTFFRENPCYPLVLLHGFMGSAASLEPVVSFLPESLGAVGIDLPGHGKSLFFGSSCVDALRSFEDVSAMILEDLLRAGIRRFSLYGYSMGGRLAQQVALDAPDRVHRLIVESAGFGIADPHKRQERYQGDLRLFDDIRSKADFDAFLDRWHDMDLFCTLSPEIKARRKSEKQKNDIDQLKKAMELLSPGNQPYLLPDLASAPFPTALLSGEKDARYMAIADGAAKTIPAARFFRFPDASHDIHGEFPRKVADVIGKFLAS